MCLNMDIHSFIQNLTKWGGALIELSAFQNPRDSKKMIDGILSRVNLSKIFKVNFPLP